ncbi:ATP synthase F0 subunit A [Candidatus Nomurabacteria bacterium RIFCSPLOWO2_01_FULL_39_18]|uniref:ATP synthase subunit a n=1 Tax=Candidatus Nomurabacteria bacterium RIFCSPHIGHO2_01_FULL_40_24b TaxID=1801739 RepID=A0A1F6V6I4_9BACT|nr:MAG: ATP synthase F0 subunit A [Candidatus Nomurabacteria bacterium RIFCSPHIGHO2_01_FULL_40_24b]OGI89175.1 MAG: ATP synthase F0 subunit A [Candidatus Nomurabacteria bacterium RIFCSPLOWO2_01_FULL_39_18]
MTEVKEIKTEIKQEEQEHAHTLFAEPIFHYQGFTVTNALLSSWFVVILIVIISLVLRSSLRVIPGKIQNFFEIIVEGALSLCDQVTNDRALSIKIFPIAISVFFFILINNWLGLLPIGGFGIIEGGETNAVFVPFLRGGTADINTTVTLAVMAVFGANLFGVFSIGLWKTFNKYVNIAVLGGIFTKIRHEPTIIIVAPITFFVGLIEIIGEFAKVASLSFRLFGNVFAGEVLLASMAALVAYAVPIPFLFLEILVGVIQALIFSILLVVYFTIGATDHDEHESREEHKLASI